MGGDCHKSEKAVMKAISQLRDRNQSEPSRIRELVQEMRFALNAANSFITNGIDLGFIRMPDADCPDPAHQTPGIIRAAITKADAILKESDK